MFWIKNQHCIHSLHHAPLASRAMHHVCKIHDRGPFYLSKVHHVPFISHLRHSPDGSRGPSHSSVTCFLSHEHKAVNLSWGVDERDRWRERGTGFATSCLYPHREAPCGSQPSLEVPLWATENIAELLLYYDVKRQQTEWNSDNSTPKLFSIKHKEPFTECVQSHLTTFQHV